MTDITEIPPIDKKYIKQRAESIKAMQLSDVDSRLVITMTDAFYMAGATAAIERILEKIKKL